MISPVALHFLTFVFCAYTSLAQTPTTSYRIGRNGMATPIVINFLADMPLPTVSYHCNNLPGICANIAARLGPGITSPVLTYDSHKGRATSRRRSSNVCGKAVRDRCAWQGACDPLFQNFPEMWPTSCDEFPFASSIEGGPGFVGPNNANQVRARRQCVPSREQSQQGRLQAILATLFAAGSAQNYRNDGFAHRYVLELDYGVRLDALGATDLRYHGRVISGGATPPPVGTPFRCDWDIPLNPNLPSTCEVFSQNPRPLPAQMPNNGYQSNLKYQGRQYNCPKAPACATPPFVPRGVDEELFVSFNASEHGLERRQISCPAPEPLDTAPAQAAAAVAAASVAAAALAELSADAALLAALIAARRLIDEIQHDVDVVQQVVSGSLPSSELATAIESAAAALSDFDNYIFVNDTSEDNQAAQDIMNGIDDATTDAFSFMQNVISIMNNDIPDDDGSFGATALVPGDVSTTSVAPTTTFVETVTPPAPPPTTTDELPAPTAGDNSFGHLIRRSYADMSDVADGALAHAPIHDCLNNGSALSMLINFSEPEILEKVRGAVAVVSDLRNRNPSLLPNLALNLPRLGGRQTHDPCVDCGATEYGTLFCGAIINAELIKLMYNDWTASDSNRFGANVSTQVHDVDLFLNLSASFIASNETSNAEYRDASDIWHYLDDHHTDAGFYPS